MFEIIQKGGVLMYPILALSVLSLAIFMERLFTLRKSRFIPQNMLDRLRAAIRNKDYILAEEISQHSDTPLGRVMSEVIPNRDEDWQQLTSIAESAGRRESDRLVRFQEALATIVALAPLLGLLGTIFGMIRLFNVLSGGGIGDPHALSGGIAEALLTTAAGLSVAIPAQVFHYIVKTRSDAMLVDLEEEVSSLSALVAPEK